MLTEIAQVYVYQNRSCCNKIIIDRERSTKKIEKEKNEKKNKEK